MVGANVSGVPDRAARHVGNFRGPYPDLRGMSIRRTLVRLSLIVSLPFAVVGLIASAAAAHGGDITIEASGSVSGTTVTYSVHMIWEDGHDVIGQGVVINASGPGGSRSATLSPTNSSGRTSGSIELGEGTWSVTFNTDGGSRTISQRIGAEPVATAAPAPAPAPAPTAAPSPAPTAAPAPPTTRRAASGSTTTTRPGATTTSVAVADATATTVAVAAETTAVPDTSTTTASTSTSTTTSSIVVTEIASSSTKDDDGGSAGLIVALVVVALIAVGGGAAFWRRRVSAPAGASVGGPGE